LSSTDFEGDPRIVDGNGDGSAVVDMGADEHVPPPTMTSVTPNSGKQGHTLDVTITGTNFTGATVVSFGDGITVNSFTVDNDTQISASITIAGDATPGTRDVSVTTPKGTGTLTDGFTIVENSPPVLSDGAVSPTSGYTSTTFTYSVTYTDADNDPPASPAVSIDGGLPKDMGGRAGDGNYTNGEIYEYTVTGAVLGISSARIKSTDLGRL
jgi:hypothetical protein